MNICSKCVGPHVKSNLHGLFLCYVENEKDKEESYIQNE